MMMMPFGRFHWAALIRSWPGPRSCSNGPSSNSQWLSSALLSAQYTVFTVQLTMRHNAKWAVESALCILHFELCSLHCIAKHCCTSVDCIMPTICFIACNTLQQPYKNSDVHEFFHLCFNISLPCNVCFWPIPSYMMNSLELSLLFVFVFVYLWHHWWEVLILNLKLPWPEGSSHVTHRKNIPGPWASLIQFSLFTIFYHITAKISSVVQFSLFTIQLTVIPVKPVNLDILHVSGYSDSKTLSWPKIVLVL